MSRVAQARIAPRHPPASAGARPPARPADSDAVWDTCACVPHRVAVAAAVAAAAAAASDAAAAAAIVVGAAAAAAAASVAVAAHAQARRPRAPRRPCPRPHAPSPCLCRPGREHSSGGPAVVSTLAEDGACAQMAAAAPRLGAGMIYGMIGPLARDDVALAVHDIYALRGRRASSPASGCWRCNRRAAA